MAIVTERVPESPELLQHALSDPNLPGWTESSNDPRFLGLTYWWARVNALGIYLGVLPPEWHQDGPGYRWFISQGRNRNPDDDPKYLKEGVADSPQQAREDATNWYNERRNKIVVRP